MPYSHDRPNMSDTTILVTIEDLIARAFGPHEKNVINFKVMQMVLHILAQQQRMLQQRVEIKIADLPSSDKEKKDTSESSASPREKSRLAKIKEDQEIAEKKEKERIAMERRAEKNKLAEEKALRAKEKIQQKELERLEKEKEKEEKIAQKEKQRAEKEALKAQELEEKEKEREQKLALKAEKETQKEKEREERRALRDMEKAERSTSKERERAERQAQKERERSARGESKERERAEKEAQKKIEREEKELQKMKEKDEKCLLDKEKEEMKALKEQERAERAAQKEKEKEDKAMLKSKEKEERSASKEREKAEREAQKEKEKQEKAALKEKERMEKEAQKERERKEREKEREEWEAQKAKALAEKPRENIDVVTQSQFALLVEAVKELQATAEPPKPLAMPDNKQLMSELTSGSATLQGTMQAMQLEARVKAAEDVIGRMTGMITQLTGSAEEMSKAKATASHKSVMIDPFAKESSSRHEPAASASVSTTISVIRPSMQSSMSVFEGVTHDEMESAMGGLREELIKSINNLTTRATSAADNALSTTKSVSEKLEIALSLDTRLSTLHSLAMDYTEQLHGFDAGLGSQMQGFEEQIAHMRNDLRGGLMQMENVNNNAETAAVMELSERYQELVIELEATLHAHHALTSLQGQLGSELHSLVECVEMMREQKADRDEVIDGLRDKADISRLAGLLTETQFGVARSDLEHRLSVCHDKFKKQETVWTSALKDLSKITDGKAEIIDLLSARDRSEKMLRDLHYRLQVLAAVLGEPDAAILKRKLAEGATCATCGVAALMSPRDASKGAPPRLPAMRTPPAGAPSVSITTGDDPCFTLDIAKNVPDQRHVCHRWVGGSHTMMTDSTRRAQASSMNIEAIPFKKYVGYGEDGRLYMMEEELKPCVECNKMEILPSELLLTQINIGAGDAVAEPGVSLHELPVEKVEE